MTNVIYINVPSDIDDYVHRIGRTGRAGNTGLATTLFTNGNRFLSQPMVKLLQGANQVVPSWLESMSKNAANAATNNPPFQRKPKRQNYDDDIGPRVSTFKTW
jgi:ATP-dependent RNA helicase DDX3X